MKLAAIDIGSNSIKLIVVDAAASDSFAVLTRVREVVRLGHETLLKGYVGPDAILRAIGCIKRLRFIAEEHGAEKIVATATAAVREAHNSTEFVDAIEHETGIRVEILSGIEEARLIGLAASYNCTIPGIATLNIDIGGGSTEISIFRDGVPLTLLSMKIGAVGLTERFFHSKRPEAKELEDVRSEIRAALARPERELQAAQWTNVTGTSGTILAIGSALRVMTSDNHNGRVINLHELTQFNVAVSEMSVSERRKRAKLTKQRAQIIVAGGLVLEGAMRTLGIESLSTCEWSLREGVIIDRLREWERLSLTSTAVRGLAGQ